MKISTSSSLILLVLAFILSHSPSQAAQWEEMGQGSASLPGLFKMADFVETPAPDHQIDDFPVITQDTDSRPVLMVHSHSTTISLSNTRVYSLGYGRGNWGLYETENNGQVMDEVKMTTKHRASVFANEKGMMISAAGFLGTSPYTSGYASFNKSSNGWSEKGGSLSETGVSDTPNWNNQVYQTGSGLDLFNGPYIAYAKGSTSQQNIFVKRFLGTGWMTVPDDSQSPLSTSGSGYVNTEPSMTFIAASPVVAWSEQKSNINTIRLKKYNGSLKQWEELGESFTTGLGIGRFPQLAALTGSNSFYLVFENRPTYSMTVTQWNGSEFIDAGDPLEPWGLERITTLNDKLAFPDPSVPSTAIAVDAKGNPIVVFRAEAPENSGKLQLFASYRQTNGDWIALSNADPTLGISDLDYPTSTEKRVLGHHAPTVMVGIDNRPVISWMVDNGINIPPMIFVKRYSEPLSYPSVLDAEAKFDQAIAILLGHIDASPAMNAFLDSNEDGMLDTADVERFISQF